MLVTLALPVPNPTPAMSFGVKRSEKMSPGQLQKERLQDD
jgi:hypothetical protein